MDIKNLKGKTWYIPGFEVLHWNISIISNLTNYF